MTLMKRLLTIFLTKNASPSLRPPAPPPPYNSTVVKSFYFIFYHALPCVVCVCVAERAAVYSLLFKLGYVCGQRQWPGRSCSTVQWCVLVD